MNTLVGCASRKTVESFRLDKLVVSSGAVLETLNKTWLLKHGYVDDRLVDWLESNKPKMRVSVLGREKFCGLSTNSNQMHD